jgi:hypothetical protein
MGKRLFIPLIFLLSIAFSSQAVTINGIAPGFVGKKVYLERYSDYITYKKTTIARTIVGDSGKFSIELATNDAFEAFLRIDNNSGIIFIDPETDEYNIAFPSLDKIHENVMKENRISLIFIDPHPDDLNTLVLEFNLRKDDFLYSVMAENGSVPFQKTNFSSEEFQKKLDVFKDSLQFYYKDIAKPFFIDYVTYSIAELELMAGIKEPDLTRAYLHSAYLKGVKVRYGYTGYMRFFGLYYADFFKVPYFGPKRI